MRGWTHVLTDLQGAINLGTESPADLKDDSAAGTPRRTRSRMPPAFRWLLILTACALLASGAYYAWWVGIGRDDATESFVSAVAQRGDLEDTVTATGTLQPKDFVDVGTQVSGQVKALLVEVGAVVKAGQLLAEIDPSVYQAKVDGDQAQLLNQRAQLADRVAQLERARQQLTRQKNLDRENATTKEALESAEATERCRPPVQPNATVR